MNKNPISLSNFENANSTQKQINFQMLFNTLQNEGGGSQEKKKENWVQCESASCMKWRKLPWYVDTEEVSERFSLEEEDDSTSHNNNNNNIN